MNPAALFFRTFLLAVFTLSLLAGAILTDYYVRHEVTRKAKRFLAERGVDLAPASAIEAARKGELILLEQLEIAGISLGSGDDRGLTPLLAAVKAGNHPSIDFLMAREAVAESINRVSEPERETPLAVALRERDFDLVEKLIGKGAGLEVDVEPGVPFLMAAVRSGDSAMIDYLLGKGVDVDYRGTQPVTALATGTITLPASSNVPDGTEILFTTTQTITTLTVNLNGAAIAYGISSPGTFNANDYFRLRFVQPANSWYRIS